MTYTLLCSTICPHVCTHKCVHDNWEHFQFLCTFLKAFCCTELLTVFVHFIDSVYWDNTPTYV
jgi:hypothetical protein